MSSLNNSNNSTISTPMASTNTAQSAPQKSVTNPIADGMDNDFDIPAFLRKSNKK